MIYCRELNKSFNTRDEMFTELLKHEQTIIGMKTAEIYKSCEKGRTGLKFIDTAKISDTVKAPFDVDDDFIYPVISSCNFFDSHGDVHFKGCFDKTSVQQQGNVVYALDHNLTFYNIIAWQKDVEMFVADVDWALLGKDYDGNTQCLVFKINKKAIQLEAVLKAIEDKASDFENSIRMRYVKVRMGVNSNAKDMVTQKAYYDAHIGLIVNRAEVEEDGYFWGVEDLAIYKEGSLVVAGGSNSATRIITGKTEDEEDTSATASTKSEHKPKVESKKVFYHNLI